MALRTPRRPIKYKNRKQRVSNRFFLKVRMQNLPGKIFNRLVVQRERNFVDKELENRFRNYTIFCLASLPTMVVFGCASLLHGNIILAAIILSCTLGLSVGWFLLYKCISGAAVFRLNCLLFCTLLLMMAYIGGEHGSKLLWSFTFPLASFFLFGLIEGIVWCVLYFIGCQFFLWNLLGLTLPHIYPPEFSLRFDLTYIFVSAITYSFQYFRHIYRLEIEKKNNMLEREIREREIYEAALKKSEELYRAVFSQAAEGILLIKSDGTILESNPQMENTLLLPVADQKGLNIFNIIHPDDLQNQPSQIPFMIKGKAITIERRMKTADGTYRLFEVSGSKLGDDTILLVCRDITERKAAEVALEKANRELDKLANIDGLTQIANRRRFDLQLEHEWKRLQRDKTPLTLILCDIDYFKQYNDLYGHQEGDSCLVMVARTLKETLRRPADLSARFGGEEFVILLPNTPLAGGVNRAEKIRDTIASLRIPHNASEVSPFVSMSFGVSSVIPFHEGLPENLVAMADKALYIAKKNGRNRVEVMDELEVVQALHHTHDKPAETGS